MTNNNSELSSQISTYTDEEANRSTEENLLSNWTYQIGILQHMVKKTREIFLHSDKVNEFPECNWFEEDDLLFNDTVQECSASVNDLYDVGDIQKFEKTISESLIELNEIVARLIRLTE